MNANDPAHPTPTSLGPNGESCFCMDSGLTKRELIAAMAMQGMMANPHLKLTPTVGQTPSFEEMVARASIQLADAFIAEFPKDQPK